MLFDTDVLILVQRGNSKAAVLVESTEQRYISTQTYMELLQYAPVTPSLPRQQWSITCRYQLLILNILSDQRVGFEGRNGKNRRHLIGDKSFSV